jgi:hypothetical protein
VKNKDTVEVLAILSEEEYFDFQNTIREVCGVKPLTPSEPFNPNEDPRIRAIKEKAKRRERVKAK